MPMEAMVNHSIATADLATHIKIVVVVLVWSIVVANVAIVLT